MVWLSTEHQLQTAKSTDFLGCPKRKDQSVAKLQPTQDNATEEIEHKSRSRAV
jgi:hypothetical protein